jgi:nucleotide-binding universal stress UspA family protein
MTDNRDSGPVVLVALDGSPAAATALPVARAVAAQLGASVQALHVVPRGIHGVDARAVLGPVADADCGVSLRVVRGDPAQEILRAGEDPRVVLVVLATHGHRVCQDGGLRGVPGRVAAETSRPVLLVRPEAIGPVAEWRPFRRLLVPVDGTPTTVEAYRPAAEIAARLRAAIDVLFVVHPRQVVPSERGTMTPPLYVDQPQYEWPAWEARVARWIRCHCDELPPDTVIHAYIASARTRGEIGDAIAKFAAEHGADGIVLVRRSHLEAGRAPILRAVFDRTPCPVLLVAGPARAPASAPASEPASEPASDRSGAPAGLAVPASG